MSVSFHLAYSSRWQDSQEAEPTKVAGTAVVAAGCEGDAHAAIVNVMSTGRPNEN